MTFAEFKELVSATMLRDASALADGDALATAINSAKRHAQLLHSFESCRTTVDYTVDATTGALLSSGVDIFTSTAIDVKQIERAFMTSETNDVELFILSGKSYRSMLRRIPNLEENRVLWIRGNRIFRRGGGTIQADVVEMLPDYSADADTDFFLTRGTDWMLFATAVRLNFFLKDDERIPINISLLEQSWRAFLSWDSGLAMPSDEARLD